MERFLNHDLEFRYQLLGRLVSDCEYFLGYGYGCEKHLWSGSVEKHIADMRLLYGSFKEDEKPDSLTLEDIDDYEYKMKHCCHNTIKGGIYENSLHDN